jgi:hypothetical protein
MKNILKIMFFLLPYFTDSQTQGESDFRSKNLYLRRSLPQTVIKKRLRIALLSFSINRAFYSLFNFFLQK